MHYIALLSLAALGILTLLFAPRESRADAEENRMLAGMPALTGESLWDGSFMTGFESWLTDGIEGRRELLRVSDTVLSLLGREEETEEQAEEALIAAIDGEMAEDLEEESPAESAAPGEELPEDMTEEDGSGTEPGTVQAASEEPEEEDPEIRETAFYLERADGSRNVRYTFGTKAVRNAAEILNMYRSVLPEGGHVLFTEVPISLTARSFQKSAEYPVWHSEMEDELQKIVDDGVIIVNGSEALLPELKSGAYCYFVTDHHWTAYGAHVVYEAAMEAMGLPFLAYDDYTYRVNARMGAGKVLNPDRLEMIEPGGPVESYVLTKLTKKKAVKFMCYDRASYTAYLGGTLGPWRLFETGSDTGHTALLIGDSYANAFLPYLLPHYDRVLMTDFRTAYYDEDEAGGTMRDYVREYGVEDVYVVVCFATSINSGKFTGGTFTRYF